MEVGVPTYWVQHFDQSSNKETLEEQLDLLEEKRQEAKTRIAINKRKAEHYFNRRVQSRSFKVGDLVLRQTRTNTKERWDCNGKAHTSSQLAMGLAFIGFETLKEMSCPTSGVQSTCKNILVKCAWKMYVQTFERLLIKLSSIQNSLVGYFINQINRRHKSSDCPTLLIPH